MESGPANPKPLLTDLELRKSVSSLRHDLRNPLGSMVGYLEMFLEDAQENDAVAKGTVELIETALRIIHEILGVINSTMDFEKILSQTVDLVWLKNSLLHHIQALRSSLDVLGDSADFSSISSWKEDLLRIDRCLGILESVAEGIGVVAGEVASYLSQPSKGSGYSRHLGSDDEKEPNQLASAAFDAAPNESLQTGMVLVVDDGEEYRDLVGRRLRRMGFRFEVASGGLEAIAMLGQVSADVVLLDIVMPGVSGIETLTRLKQSPLTKDIPVIMLSSADEAGTVVECIKRGADDFVPKPVNSTLLRTRLEASLAKRRLKLAGMTEGSFFYDRGTMRQDSPSYIERRADKELFEHLMHGEFCYVLTSRQMGKSSMMVRTAARLRGNHVSSVVMDLTAIGLNVTPEQWYEGLVLRLGQQLRMEDDLEDFWEKAQGLSAVQRFFAAIHIIVLPRLNRSLVVFIDELDTIRSLPFSTDEFFGAIRECHQRRATEPLFSRLSFCLLGVATPNQLVRDSQSTPFNIARRIELTDFTLEESSVLAAGFQRSPDLSRKLLERVYYWTHGHPYLTQRLCRLIALDPSVRDIRNVDSACKRLFLTARARDEDDNLVFIRRHLLEGAHEKEDVLRLYLKVRDGNYRFDDSNETSESAYLRFMGLVRVEGDRLVVRNRIYARSFDSDWVQQQLHLIAEVDARHLEREGIPV